MVCIVVMLASFALPAFALYDNGMNEGYDHHVFDMVSGCPCPYAQSYGELLFEYRGSITIYTWDEKCVHKEARVHMYGYYGEGIYFDIEDDNEIYHYDIAWGESLGYTEGSMYLTTDVGFDEILCINFVYDAAAIEYYDFFALAPIGFGFEGIPELDHYYCVGESNGYNNGWTDGEDNGYGIGYGVGYTEGETAGHTAGKTEGYNLGYSAGEQSEVTSNFISIVGEIALAPYTAVSSMFDFEIFGINVAGFFFQMFTVVLALLVIGIILKYTIS